MSQKPIVCQNDDTVNVIDFTLFKGWEKARLHLEWLNQ